MCLPAVRELLVRGAALRGADRASPEREHAGARQQRRHLQLQLDAVCRRRLQHPRHSRWLPGTYLSRLRYEYSVKFKTGFFDNFIAA